MFETAIIFAWTVLLVWWAPRWLRGTVLEFDTARGMWWPMWLYEQFLLVLPAPILLATLGVQSFPSTLLVVKNGQTFIISMLVLYAITIFFATLGFSIRLLPKRWMIIGGSEQEIDQRKVNRFVNVTMLGGLGVMIAGILFMGFHNALIDVLVTGKGLNEVRIANKYQTSMPSQVQFVIAVAAWVAAIHAGYTMAWRKRGRAFVCLAGAIVLAGADGGKAPMVQVLLLAGTGYAVAAQKRLNLKMVLIWGLFGIPILLLALYGVVRLQVQGINLEKFIGFLVDRIGMAQMAGTYDGIALGPLSGHFGWHMVPFANFFEDYVPYAKALMMHVEGYDYDQVGVKNSFFVSEAYGIGGYWLVIASPFIVGFCWVISAVVFYRAMKWMFGRDVAGLYFLPISILYMNLTGGFSPFPLFKGLLLMLSVFCVFWAPWFLLSLLPRKRERWT